MSARLQLWCSPVVAICSYQVSIILLSFKVFIFSCTNVMSFWRPSLFTLCCFILFLMVCNYTILLFNIRNLVLYLQHRIVNLFLKFVWQFYLWSSDCTWCFLIVYYTFFTACVILLYFQGPCPKFWFNDAWCLLIICTLLHYGYFVVVPSST
jgi:hypothetical protein